MNFIRRLDKIQHDRAETTDRNVFPLVSPKLNTTHLRCGLRGWLGLENGSSPV